MPILFRTGRAAAAISAAIEAEWSRTVAALDIATGQTERLADNPALARSIAHRFAYIAPLNYLQAELLRRWRAGLIDHKARVGILIAINGIAAGCATPGDRRNKNVPGARARKPPWRGQGGSGADQRPEDAGSADQ